MTAQNIKENTPLRCKNLVCRKIRERVIFNEIIEIVKKIKIQILDNFFVFAWQLTPDISFKQLTLLRLNNFTVKIHSSLDLIYRMHFYGFIHLMKFSKFFSYIQHQNLMWPIETFPINRNRTTYLMKIECEIESPKILRNQETMTHKKNKHTKWMSVRNAPWIMKFKYWKMVIIRIIIW